MALRLGGFHITLIMLAVIGKRFVDSGLQSILIESGIVGSSAVQGVLSGKHYNRAIRCQKIVRESFFRMCWRAFEKWLEDNPQRHLSAAHTGHLAQTLNRL